VTIVIYRTNTHLHGQEMTMWRLLYIKLINIYMDKSWQCDDCYISN